MTELFRFDHLLETFGYTSAEEDVRAFGVVFEAASISREELQQTDEDNAGALTLTLPATSAVARLFVEYLPPAPVQVRLYNAEGSNPSPSFVGTVASASFEESVCTLTCEPAMASMRRAIPVMLYQKTCNHSLFSQTVKTALGQRIGCNVDKSAYRSAVTVAATNEDTVTVSAHGKADCYFAGGYLEDPVTTEKRWIVSQAGNVLHLVRPWKLPAGTAVNLYPGCDKTEAICAAKFNNLVNFSGFSLIPSKNPFNTSIT